MDEQRRMIPSETEEDEIDLGLLFRGMWKAFRRFWWAVLLLIALGAGGYSAFQLVSYEPVYRSSATFTVTTAESGSGTYSFYYDSTTADQMSRTFPYILESSFFRSALLERLDQTTLNGTISAETIEESNVVTMTVESSSAEDARMILDAALEIYPETARFVLGEITFNYLDEPETPTAPYNQVSLRRTVVLGGGVGFLAALCFLAALSLSRKTARDPEEMKKITSLRCMASVPHVAFKAHRQKRNSSIAVWEKRVHHGYRESLASLAIRVEKELKKRKGRLLLVTSTASGEGKSSLAVNLAASLAERGSRVLLIDGDLRKQSDAEILGAKGAFSLADAAGDRSAANYEELLEKLKHPDIFFFGGNAGVKQPASLLSSRGVQKFLRDMRGRMDYIILDTPPSGMFQDAAVLADEADGILFVVKYDYVPQRQIWECFSSLRGRKAEILGYVFNEYPEAASEYGYGRYGYGRYGYGYRKYGYQHYGKDYGEETE